MNKNKLIRKLESIEFSAYVMQKVDFAHGKGDAQATLSNISDKLLSLIEEIQSNKIIRVERDSYGEWIHREPQIGNI